MTYTHASGKRSLSADDRAHDFLASSAASTLPPADIAATLRVLLSWERADLGPLWDQVTTDGSGNPIVATDEQRLHHATWSEASILQERVRELRLALEHGR
ncbi:hypothetical protein CGZ93_10360 [Enemella dayhoffiae]|uniref:Uncharacterized protein n=1 Tax=Enemella dayhoffiae TaxID=2016507 RepID=A0A255H1J8_9ACTN|nr:hypothetical protein [Enemella dayhoffiae]OYO21472.1 hypothetical protein CGZ93_10360 [Enemella dayhoffiae]